MSQNRSPRRWLLLLVALMAAVTIGGSMALSPERERLAPVRPYDPMTAW